MGAVSELTYVTSSSSYDGCRVTELTYITLSSPYGGWRVIELTYVALSSPAMSPELPMSRRPNPSRKKPMTSNR